MYWPVPLAREHGCDQVTIGFSLASDWSRKWRKFFEPIAVITDGQRFDMQTRRKGQSGLVFGSLASFLGSDYQPLFRKMSQNEEPIVFK